MNDLLEKRNETASEAVQRQLATIQHAIALLQESADRMTAQVDPETKSWGDVGQFAKTSSLAFGLIESMNEN